jgi:DNA-binding response OmpR family regulator
MLSIDPAFGNPLPTLVVDPDAATANQLAVQLSHSGFPGDVATSCWAALAATGPKRYRALVVVADLSQPGDLGCLTALRTKAPGAWIIVIASRAPPNAQRVIFECGADSLLVAPFSVEDLPFVCRRSRADHGRAGRSLLPFRLRICADSIE